MIGDFLAHSEAQASSDTRLRGGWLIGARVIWATAALLTLGLFAASLAPYYQDLISFSIAQINSPELVRGGLAQLGVAPATYAGAILAARVVFTIAHVVVALLIFARRSDDRVALLFSFTLIATGVTLNTTLESLPQHHPNAALSAAVDLLKLYGGSAIFIFCYLFPDGRFVPRWTRLAAIGFIAVQVCLIYLRGSPLDPNTWPLEPRLIMYGGLFGSCLFAPIYRYRCISDGPQRQQIKWAVFGFAIALAGMIGLIVALLAYALLVPPGPPRAVDALIELAGVLVFLLCFLAVPIAVAVAILRYRLWEIDILIRRTLVYGALTAALALVYVGGVALLQAIVRPLTGAERSQLATVGSTLLMAALFMPLRRRIQSAIDRRFFRRKYDAVKTLVAFSAQMRDEVDLHILTGELLAVVEQTMQPAHVSLWLRPDPAPRGVRPHRRER